VSVSWFRKCSASSAGCKFEGEEEDPFSSVGGRCCGMPEIEAYVGSTSSLYDGGSFNDNGFGLV
jgi:hypothetical protein